LTYTSSSSSSSSSRNGPVGPFRSPVHYMLQVQNEMRSCLYAVKKGEQVIDCCVREGERPITRHTRLPSILCFLIHEVQRLVDRCQHFRS
ncbi:hypothetical protein L9F63_009614, partial [Diploptera punctata]